MYSPFKNDIAYIDYREPPLVQKELSNYFNTHQIPTKIAKMEVGDIYYNGILVERKDCVDFVNSWRDSRLQNQRYRMIMDQKKKNVHCYVIIQGQFREAQQQINMINTLTNLSFTHWAGGIASLNEMGISTIQLEERTNHQQLAEITHLLAKHKNEEKEIHEVFIEPDGQNWDMKAYQCISGIGYRKAKALSEKISIQDLLRRTRENAISTLCEVPGIGKKQAKNIYETIHKPEDLTPFKDL